MEIRDASALVTGAGRGIGRSIALALAREGARLTVVSRTAPELDTLVEEIETVGGRGVAFAGDLRSPSACNAAVATAVECFGGLQILVNNAGVGVHSNLGDTTDEEWGTDPRDEPLRPFPPRPRRASPPRPPRRAHPDGVVAGREEPDRGPGRLLRQQGRPRPARRLPDARGPPPGRQGHDHRPGLGGHRLRRGPALRRTPPGCSHPRTWPRRSWTSCACGTGPTPAGLRCARPGPRSVSPARAHLLNSLEQIEQLLRSAVLDAPLAKIKRKFSCQKAKSKRNSGPALTVLCRRVGPEDNEPC